ncbi:MAG: hypothetical protein J5I93_23915, partial [Pirellulaceae bacterium]|nr:hypothetical protein [Pirellulaceae bacterium]
LAVVSGYTGVVTVAPATLTFTPGNWNHPQTVIVTGVDHPAADGNQVTIVTISVVAASSDDAFDGLADQSVSVTTIDDDSPGISVTQSDGGTVVGVTGTTDTITVMLTAQPSSNVVLSVVSGDTGEATVAPATLTFTPGNWNQPQTVTVTGVDDPAADGNQVTIVTISVVAASSDDAFDGLADQTVSVTTIDDDSAASPVVRLSLQATDLQGNPIATIHKGRPFLITLLAEDVSAAAAGVFAAYADLNFDSDAMEPVETVLPGPEYLNGVSGQFGQGIVDEWGAFGSLTSPGAGPLAVVSVEFRGDRAGQFDFTIDAAEQHPEHSVLTYASSSAIPEERIEFRSTSIRVVEGWRNPRNPYDVNDDGIVAPNDVLAIILRLNATGSGPLPTPSDDLAPPPYVDVVGDNVLAPNDALAVINYLNSRGSAEGEASPHSDAFDRAVAEMFGDGFHDPLVAEAQVQSYWQLGVRSDLGWQPRDQAVRNLWAIENTLHWSLDMTYREDETSSQLNWKNAHFRAGSAKCRFFWQ